MCDADAAKAYVLPTRPISPCWTRFTRAFPWHEQRESEAKRQALSHPRYALEAWFDEGVFVGLSGCWQFAGYGYIEHLAIDDTLRSRGYGKQLLAQI